MGDPGYVWIVDFGENPTTATVSAQDPPGGPWEVQIDSFEGTTEGKGSVRFMVSIVEEGEARGIGTQITIGTDQTKPFNVKHATNLMDGLHSKDGNHLDRSKLRGRMELSGQLFVGMRAYMWVREYPEGEIDERGFAKRPDRNFMSRAEYESQKRAQAARGGPPPPRPSPVRPQGPSPGPSPVGLPMASATPTPAQGQPTATPGPVNAAPPVPVAQPAAMGALKDLFGPAAQ